LFDTWQNDVMHVAVRRLFYGLRTECAGVTRDAVAVGTGAFIGCLPVYGFHLLLCWIVGWLLRLNRLKVYIAANISNPLFAPMLLFTEVQTGAWVRGRAFHPLTVEAVRTTDLSVFGYDLLVGSVVIGATLGVLLGAVTYASTRNPAADAPFLELVRAASDRYLMVSITAWEFARGKLRRDPLYRSVVRGSLLPSGGTLLDIGCGSGLTLALIAEARSAFEKGQWPATWGRPPGFDRMVGIETRARASAIAREALGPDAEILHGDARSTALPRCRAVLLFDVLHMMPAMDQDTVIAAVAGALEPGGTLLVREADPTGGRWFAAVRFGNRLKALAFGHWRQRFHFRTPEHWLETFAVHGLSAEMQPMGEGTPFANVLFKVTAPAHVFATTRQPSPVG
jgi:uncharacterized protein (DUF2062 family)/SAM-dependent methyltransferase